MMKRKYIIIVAALVFAIGSGIGLYVSGKGLSDVSLVSTAEAAGGAVKDPNGVAPDRYIYFPGTEKLGKDEIRLIALGTGMPAARRSQAATCWLVEVGNGDKFLFDIGTGANANMAALMIPFDFLTTVFLTHLHTDHWGDLPGLWAGGWTAGRTVPLEIYGPSGAREDMGTKYAVEHFLKAYNWDNMTRLATLPSQPGKINVHEFDYKGENKTVYEKNGVTIKSWPAIHAGDGAVSFALYWKGMKVVIGGDTKPNTWYIKYAADADVAIHEAFLTPEQLVSWYGQSPQSALAVGTYVHTPPQAFGKVMSTIKPKHAIAYHFLNESDTRDEVYSAVRETYDGPLTLAEDNLVWNITKDNIKVRKIVSDDDAWSQPGPNKPQKPDHTVPGQLSKQMLAGEWDISEVTAEMVKEFKKKYNMK
ncbi:MAG: MBL fold metallo-hydrolase [Deltaproteobacteria bacterium]|nr:MBL fold metallo-hydrolase [Deltaproteobacteria bacterium]MBW2711891.1 MBL fold metallo-hydrolase [Deltaproteobacteria bacterium]